MSILNGVAHQLLCSMDVMIQKYKIFLWTAVVQRDSSMRVKKNEINQGSLLEEQSFLLPVNKSKTEKKPVNQFENHSLKVFP